MAENRYPATTRYQHVDNTRIRNITGFNDNLTPSQGFLPLDEPAPRAPSAAAQAKTGEITPIDFDDPNSSFFIPPDREYVDTTAQPAPDGGYGTLLSMGAKRLAQSALGIADLLGADVANMQESVARAVEADYKSLSPEQRRRVDAKWFSIDKDSVLQNPMAIISQLTVELPTLATVMAPGLIAGRVGATIAKGALEKSAAAAGKRAAGQLGAVGIPAEAVRKSVTDAALTKGAPSIGRAAAAAGAAAGGATEGAFVAGISADQIRTGIMEVPTEVLETSPEYLRLLDEHGNEKAAREALIESLGPTAWATGAASSILGAVASGYVAKMLFGKPGGTRLGNAGKAFLAEGPVTEGPQEVLEDTMVTGALQRADASKETQPAESFLAGATLGGIPGAAVGALAHTSPPPIRDVVVDEDLAALKEEKADLWKIVAAKHDLKTPRGRLAADIEFSNLADDTRGAPPVSATADDEIGRAKAQVQARGPAGAGPTEGGGAPPVPPGVPPTGPTGPGTPPPPSDRNRMLTAEEVKARMAGAGLPMGTSRPAPESQATIDAQAELVNDPNNPKTAMTVTPGSPQPTNVGPGVSKVEFLDENGEANTLYTTDAELANLAGQADVLTDSQLGQILYGRPEGKIGSDGVVIVARNAEGLPVHEVLTSADTFQRDLTGARAVMPAGGMIELSTAPKQLAERRTLAEVEQDQTIAAAAPGIAGAAVNAADAAAKMDEAVEKEKASDAPTARAATAQAAVASFFSSREAKKVEEGRVGQRDTISQAEPGATKKSAAVALKESLNKVLDAAVEGGVIPRGEVERLSTAARIGVEEGQAPVANLLEKLTSKLAKSNPLYRSLVLAAVEQGDIDELTSLTDYLADILMGGDAQNLDVAGTPLEPVEAQVRRGSSRATEFASREADKYGRPKGVAKFDWVTAVRSMDKVVRKLLDALGSTSDAITTAAGQGKKKTGYGLGFATAEENAAIDKEIKEALQATKLFSQTDDDNMGSVAARKAFNALTKVADRILASPTMQTRRERETVVLAKHREKNKGAAKPAKPASKKALTPAQHKGRIMDGVARVTAATTVMQAQSAGTELALALIGAGATKAQAEKFVMFALEQRAELNTEARTILREDEIAQAAGLLADTAQEEYQEASDELGEDTAAIAYDDDAARATSKDWLIDLEKSLGLGNKTKPDAATVVGNKVDKKPSGDRVYTEAEKKLFAKKRGAQQKKDDAAKTRAEKKALKQKKDNSANTVAAKLKAKRAAEKEAADAKAAKVRANDEAAKARAAAAATAAKPLTEPRKNALVTLKALATALKPSFMKVEQFMNLIAIGRMSSAAGTAFHRVFGTGDAPSPVARAVAAFRKALTPEQRKEFDDIVALYTMPRNVDLHPQLGNPTTRYQLLAESAELRAFVERTGIAVPKALQYRTIQKGALQLEPLVSESEAMANATPEGALKPFLPAVAELRAKAQKAARLQNDAITRRNDAAKVRFVPTETHEYSEDGPGDKVAMADLVVEFAEATRVITAHASDLPAYFSGKYAGDAEYSGVFSEDGIWGPGLTSLFGDKVFTDLGINLNSPMKGLRTILEAFSKNEGISQTFGPLLTRLLAIAPDTTVVFSKHSDLHYVSGMMVRTRLPNGKLSHVINLGPNALDPARVGETVIVLLHEAVHAATTSLLEDIATGRNKDGALLITGLIDVFNQARAASPDSASHYGMRNLQEFVAEALTSPAFRTYLNGIMPVEAKKTWWRNLMAGVAKLLGMADEAPRLETLLGMAEQASFALFEPALHAAGVEGGVSKSTPKAIQDLLGTKERYRGKSTLVATPFAPRAARMARELNEKTGFGDKLQRAHLGFMNLDTLERKYRSLSDKIQKVMQFEGGSPLARLVHATTSASNLARDIANTHVNLSRATAALEFTERENLYKAMIESTLSGYFIDRALTSPHNSHLWDKKGNLKDEPAVRKAMAARDALTPAAKLLYSQWRQALTQERQMRLGVLVKHATRTAGMTEGEAAKLYDFIVNQGKLGRATAQYMKTLPNANKIKDNDLDDLATTIKKILDESELVGPYFPLHRDGDFAVTTPDGSHFEMHDNEREANKAAAALRAKGQEAFVTRALDTVGDLAPADLQKLADEIRRTASTLPPSGLTGVQAEAYNQFNTNIQHAITKILASRTLYSSKLKRKGILGTLPKDMAKALESHSRASVSVVSTLDGAFDYNSGLNDLRKVSLDYTLQQEGDLTQDEHILVGDIYNEMVMRASTIASDRDVTTTDQVLGRIGFFTYLGSPAYWLLNATQTAVVGMPVLAGLADVSGARAVMSLKRAYGTLKKITKGMGWRALDDLNAVIARLPQDQQEVMLKLIDDNAIQSTLAHEIGLLTTSSLSMSQTKAGQYAVPIYNAVVDVLQAVPDMVERFNRMSMALAAMDAGVTDYTKIKDIVLASQFNYDSANRARLLKVMPKWAGSGARHIVTPMMMFKVFGVQMAELVYGNLYDGFLSRAKTPAERARARKIFGGLVATHTVFGGLTGGLGLGLASTILAGINGLLDDEDKIDPERALTAFLTEHAGEYAASIMMRGAPAALGADFSRSINLGSLLWMSKDTNWAQYGGIEQSVYSLLGPIAQYIGGGVIRPAAQLMDGDISVAKFLETAVPLRLYKGLSQAVRQQVNGLETQAGQSFMQPDEVSVWDSTVAALGMRPVAVTMRQDLFYGDRTYSRVLENRKGEIIDMLRDAKSQDERADARREQSAWNAKMRERGNFRLIVTSRSVDASRKAHRQVQDEYSKGQYTRYD